MINHYRIIFNLLYKDNQNIEKHHWVDQNWAKSNFDVLSLKIKPQRRGDAEKL